MTPQQDLYNRYMPQQQHYTSQLLPPPQNPMLQQQEPDEHPTPGSSFLGILFWIFVGMALMGVAFYLGFLDFLRPKPKEQQPTDNVPKPLTYEIIEELDDEDDEFDFYEEEPTDQETEFDRKFNEVHEKYGLLDKSLMNGHNLGISTTQEPQKDDPQD